MKNSEQIPFHFIGGGAAVYNGRWYPIERVDYEVCTIEYIVSGFGTLEENGHSWHLGKDDVYILRKHSNHRYVHDTAAPWHKIFFVTDGQLMERIFDSCLDPDDYVFHNCGSVFHYFETFMKYPIARENRELNGKAALLFHNLLFELAELKESSLAKTPELELKIHLDGMLGRSFSLQRYADEAGYTKSYLIRRFRAAYDCTPYEYLIRMKIRKAEEMLKYTTLQVKEVADQLAFPDQGSFSRCFRLRTGISPKESRKQS